MTLVKYFLMLAEQQLSKGATLLKTALFQLQENKKGT